jgi:hypothetical protein
MRYRVHHVDVEEGRGRDALEQVLERLTGDLVEIVPILTPVMRPYGAAGRTKELLVVERLPA